MRSVESPVAAPSASYAAPVTGPAPAPVPSSRTHPSAGLAMLMIVGGGLLTQLLTTVTGILSARMLGVEGRGQIVRRTPAGRLGEPADVARAVQFLTDPGNTYLTGQILVVDGGLTC